MKKSRLQRYLLILCSVFMLCMTSEMWNRFLLQGNQVLAAEGEMVAVTVEEEDFTIMIPSECYVLKQNIEEGNAYIEKVGADREQIQEYFQNAGIVLDAIEENNTYEIVVTVTQNQNVNYIYNMKSISDDMLQEFSNTIAKSYETYGYTIDNQSVYENDMEKYAVLYFSQTTDENQISCIQYDTIKGNKVYNITLRYYGEDVPITNSQAFRSVVDSISFLGDSEIVSFTDSDSGVTFDVKDGWEEINNNNGNAYIKAQFMHTNGLGESMQFLCMDIWGNMDMLHQLRSTRESIDTQHKLTDAEKKTYQTYFDVFFSDYANTKQVQYNGIWYVTSDELLPIKEKNINGNYLQRTMATIQNGILYVFQYGYYESSNLHETDFEYLMENITYKTPGLLKNDQKNYQRMANFGYGMIAVIVLVVVIIVFVVYLYISGSEKREE